MWATVRAWAGSARPGRCKYCRRAFVWVITDRGKYLPFDLGFTIREIVTVPETQERFIVLNRDDRHDCRERNEQRANKRSQRGGNTKEQHG